MARQRPVACAQCGALNGAEFATCVRCGRTLRAQDEPSAGRGARPSPGSAQSVRQAPSSDERPGGRPSARWASFLDGRKLVATKVFLGLTLLVFGGQVAAGLQRGLPIEGLLFGADPVDAVRFGALRGLTPETWWRCLSAVFVHFGLLHVLLNMVALVQLSRLAEPALGSARFAIVYVVSGIMGFAASAAHAEITGRAVLFTAGASGAVFGVVGLVLGLLLKLRDPRWKAWAVQAAFFLVLSNAMARVNNVAHVGGLAAGALGGFLLARGARAQPLPWHLVAGALCLVACVASLLLAQASPMWHLLELSRPS